MHCVRYLYGQLSLVCYSKTSDIKTPRNEDIRVHAEAKTSSQIQGCALPKTKKTELRPCYLGPWLCKH